MSDLFSPSAYWASSPLAGIDGWDVAGLLGFFLIVAAGLACLILFWTDRR